ncbi:hypothetical protein HPB49_018160 [Dermacentor silvarum]|uniref:Uncharacterized protein n=2 Tax=Dermacentor silvarum TaxID=543639 RepID=A0ACB8DF79_DERSI|nr:hypothetical protein HPB49_018160 [Dermacentor silvarum]
MLIFCVVVMASLSYASSGAIRDANIFVDTIFQEKMPLLVKESPRLFPYATIEDFSFKVSKNGRTNRDLEVNMTRGEIHGLDHAVQRQGDCRAPDYYSENVTIFCSLTLQGLNVTFTALAQGDTLSAIRKTIWVNVAVRRTAAFFEASPYTGRDATLFTFHIGSFQLSVAYGHSLILNEGRSQKFKEEISARVKKELMSIFTLEYKDLLSPCCRIGQVPQGLMVTFPKALSKTREMVRNKELA